MRKTTQLSPSTKVRLQEMHKHLGFKNESQVVAYLLSLYDIKYPTLTVPDHEKCKRNAFELEDQGAF